jgi:lipopolysaccharide biosynthesis protein
LIILVCQLAQLPADISRQFLILGSRSLGQSRTGTPPKVLVIVHAYWPQQFVFIINRLNQIRMPLSIVVTIPDGENRIQIEDLLTMISKHHEVSFMRVENAGRDVGPFLIAIESFADSNWDLVIKLHTKASQRVWFETLVSSLIKSDRRIQNYVKLLKKYPNGIIVHPYFRYPGHKQSYSEPAMKRLRKVLLSKNYPLPQKWYFAAGSMYAASPSLMIDFKRVSENLGFDQFEDENEYSQASCAHVLERFLGLHALDYGSGLFGTSICDYLDIKAISVKMI